MLDVGLLLLLDSRSPAGGHNHSGGMEPAVVAGMVSGVEDVRDFCRGRLLTAGRVAAAFAATAADRWPAGPWQDLDDDLTARMPSAAQRDASRNLGRGLSRLLRATRADFDFPRGAHHSLVLGAGCAMLGGSRTDAARAAALQTCVSPASAAVRLLGLDPYAVHGILAALADEISVVADDACSLTELPALSAPALDLLADVHHTQEVRLFAS